MMKFAKFILSRFLLYRRQHKKENFETTGLSENAKGKNEKKSGKLHTKLCLQLNAYHDAKFALESHNIDLTAITSSNIKILQNRLEQAEQDMYNLEEQQQQNERDLKELQRHQKEIDTYLGKKHEDI